MKGDGIVSGSLKEAAAAEGGGGTGDAKESAPEEGHRRGVAEESDDEWGVDPGIGPGAPG